MSTDLPHIVIAGGSGFLGRGLAEHLIARGYAVTILSRSPHRDPRFDTSVQWVQWDAKTFGDWAGSLDGAAAVVNLVGRTVDCRKTEANKKVILESRVDSCRVLGEVMRQIDRPPAVWIQSATAHIVGDPNPRDTVCDETTPPGPTIEMAPRVGLAWEQAFNQAVLPDQRGVILRISFVLGAQGGAMDRLRLLTRLGLGGTVGRGDQYISWIQDHDLHRLIIDAIEDHAYHGAYMVTAPKPVTNRIFMREMRRAYHRPWSPPAPAWVVRLAARFLLNTDPQLALLGRRCVPTRLLREHDFRFDYPGITSALAAIRDKEQSRRP